MNLWHTLHKLRKLRKARRVLGACHQALLQGKPTCAPLFAPLPQGPTLQLHLTSSGWPSMTFTQMHRGNTLWTDQAECADSERWAHFCCCGHVQPHVPGAGGAKPQPHRKCDPSYLGLRCWMYSTGLAHWYSHPTQTWHSVGCFKLGGNWGSS